MCFGEWPDLRDEGRREHHVARGHVEAVLLNNDAFLPAVILCLERVDQTLGQRSFVLEHLRFRQRGFLGGVDFVLLVDQHLQFGVECVHRFL